MNNNMPNNNFNNGMPTGDTGAVPNMPNPTVDAANQQLIGGQSAVGSTINPMQGVANVPQEGNAMQGVGPVPNMPNIMQGTPEPAAPEPVTMPGQGNSGVNAFTMQKEEAAPEAPKAEDPGVVSIPSFAANVPETPQPPVPDMGVVNDAPVNPVMPDMGAVNPAGSGVGMSNMQNDTVVSPNPLNPMNNVIGNQVDAPNVNIIQEPNIPNTPEQPMGNDPLMNSVGPQENMTPPVMGAPMPETSISNPMNNQIGDVNNSVTPSTSQIGQSDLGALDNDLAEMPDMPAKKFPLSVREMVLIGIALVGIIEIGRAHV